MHVKTILVPCDFSEHSERAFAWARQLAADRGAKLVLLHVVGIFARGVPSGGLVVGYGKA
jgi:nucleotide-binding universal stress UspA family protein